MMQHLSILMAPVTPPRIQTSLSNQYESALAQTSPDESYIQHSKYIHAWMQVKAASRSKAVGTLDHKLRFYRSRIGV